MIRIIYYIQRKKRSKTIFLVASDMANKMFDMWSNISKKKVFYVIRNDNIKTYGYNVNYG